jgi:hypothetical protein
MLINPNFLNYIETFYRFQKTGDYVISNILQYNDNKILISKCTARIAQSV